MSITYEEALQTLQSMFQDPWTRDGLDVVLRNQKGHMENTVDLILRHGDRDPQILVDQLEAGIDPQQTVVAADEALARQLSQGRVVVPPEAPDAGTTHAATGAAAAASGGGAAPEAAAEPRSSGKGKPTTLPDDFLRVPGFVPSANSLSDDEALARMLQDELFTEELRRNPDFAHLARGQSQGQRRAHPHASAATRPGGSGGSNPAQQAAQAAAQNIREFASRFTSGGGSNRALNNNNQGNNVPPSPNIMEKLSEMGDGAKRRLQILAAQFNAKNNPNNPGGGVPHQSASAAGASPSEFRGLLDDDDNDNMELAARKDL